jgi:predicted RNA-binding Zn ribbon-like protein
MSATSASDRFEIVPAPDDLHLTHEIVNSAAVTGFAPPDLLADEASARQWLEPVLQAWCARHDETPPDLDLTESDLRRLRSLRTHLRALLSNAGATKELAFAVTVHAGPNGVHASPRGQGIAWVESAVASELLIAREHDELRRLKLCRNDRCVLGFYDRSKNNSRVWHDLAHCGTPMHVREYRKRLRGAG